MGVNLTVSSFQIRIGHQPGTAMPGAGNVDDVEVVLLDDSVQVNINKIEPGRSAPMSE